ncbi:MAG: hypothetical protein ACOY46_07885 [Bacillota bacterium]
MLDESSLFKKVIQEIEKTGFPLEMRVAEMLRMRGYLVTHSLYYIDEDENKSREVDLRAINNYEFVVDEDSYYVRNCLLIECKKSESRPWVILSSQKEVYDLSYETVPHLPSRRFIDRSDYDILEEIHPFGKYLLRGRSYFEAFKSNESGEMIFKAITTAVKATLYTMKKRFAAGDNSICFYYPIIVFDGVLYQATLCDGKISTEEVDSLLLTFLYESSPYINGQFTVPILKEKALPMFLEGLEKSLLEYGKIAERKAHQAFKRVEEKRRLKEPYVRRPRRA